MDNLFGIGMPELILILIIAGIVMGPERIGQIARWLGKTTAQLQTISRSFMRQLNNELDGLDDGHALRDAMEEVKILRKELQSLRTEFTSVTASVTAEGKTALDEQEYSIQPPILKPVSGEKVGKEETAVNGALKMPLPTASELPKLAEVPDDPE
jgi:Sec-independent protein translocase protein TatA